LYQLVVKTQCIIFEINKGGVEADNCIFILAALFQFDADAVIFISLLEIFKTNLAGADVCAAVKYLN